MREKYGVRVKEFWPPWIWVWLTSAHPSKIPPAMCFDTAFVHAFDILRRNLAVSLYNNRIWPPLMPRILFRLSKRSVYVFSYLHSFHYWGVPAVIPLRFIQSPKKEHGNTVCSAERKHHHTSRLHPPFPKNAMDVILKGEKKANCQAKYRLCAHYEGFPKQTCKVICTGRGGLYGKMREMAVCFNPEGGKQMDQKVSHKC